MKPAFVLDVSACLPWCCEDEATSATDQLLDWATRGSTLHVPALWVWEIVNVINVTVRRKRITSDQAREFLEQLATLDFRIEPPPSAADLLPLQALAERHRLTAYDDAYLDLALRLSLPLATADDGLRTAALAEGLELLG